LLSLVAFALFLYLAYQFGCSTSPSRQLSTSSSESVVVPSSYLAWEGGVRYVMGSAKNMSSRGFRYVQISINLYNDSGVQVGSTIANVNNLAAGDTWAFKAVVIEDGVTRFEIKDITAF
jgi:hypothetical protein